MQPFLQFLPDMEYAFSAFDEPNVFVPHDVFHAATSECSIPDEDTTDPWEIDTEWPSKAYFNQVRIQRIWDIGTRCTSFFAVYISSLGSNVES